MTYTLQKRNTIYNAAVNSWLTKPYCRLSNHPDLVGILPILLENPDFDICFDKYTRTPNRAYLTETDTQKT